MIERSSGGLVAVIKSVSDPLDMIVWEDKSSTQWPPEGPRRVTCEEGGALKRKLHAVGPGGTHRAKRIQGEEERTMRCIHACLPACPAAQNRES